jgi:hypothetical protein
MGRSNQKSQTAHVTLGNIATHVIKNNQNK